MPEVVPFEIANGVLNASDACWLEDGRKRMFVFSANARVWCSTRRAMLRGQAEQKQGLRDCVYLIIIHSVCM